MEPDILKDLFELLRENWPQLFGFGVPTASAIGTAILAFRRRPKSSVQQVGPYFAEEDLLTPPLTRPAYSDRMAYVLAEMSELAYYQFEGQQGLVEDALDQVRSLDLLDDADIRDFLNQFSMGLMGGKRLNPDVMTRILENSGFQLLGVVNVVETQGFVCKRNKLEEPAYLVLAFRGTERKVSDWLTDAHCVPTVKGSTKVHSGFLEAFSKKRGSDGKTTQEVVEKILQSEDAKDERGNPLPLFLTGHSLGGALALLATKLIAPNIDGACYTFGAPRVANYEYFRSIKTPVFRIVNSSDIVPRVPPGAIMQVLVGLIRGVSWILGFVPAIAPFFEKLEAFVDRLNGYGHFGDLRYLSDVAEGQFDTVRLVTNPPAIDRIVWMWRRLGKSLFVPIKSHGMSIYRKKIYQIATNRNREN